MRTGCRASDAGANRACVNASAEHRSGAAGAMSAHGRGRAEPGRAGMRARLRTWGWSDSMMQSGVRPSNWVT